MSGTGITLFIISWLTIEILSMFIYKFHKNSSIFSAGVQYVEFLSRGTRNFSGPIESRPYCLYWNRPNYFRHGFQQTDSNGFRFKGYNVNLLKERVRIMAYGGSTTYGDYVLKDPEKCWTSKLEQLLLENGKDFEVINCGLNYGLTTELASHLLFEGTHFRPDFVILHGPGNDLLPLVVGDKTLDYRNTRESRHLSPRFFEPLLLRNSFLMRLIYSVAFRRFEWAKFEPQRQSWDSAEVQNKRLLNADLSSFQNNVRNFVGICLMHNIKVILIDFLQNSQSALERITPGLSIGTTLVVEKMNNYFANLALDHPNSVYHIKFKLDDFEEHDFVDQCHLTEIGEIKKAKIIFGAIDRIT